MIAITTKSSISVNARRNANRGERPVNAIKTSSQSQLIDVITQLTNA
jgi:hypothetical protein